MTCRSCSFSRCLCPICALPSRNRALLSRLSQKAQPFLDGRVCCTVEYLCSKIFCTFCYADPTNCFKRRASQFNTICAKYGTKYWQSYEHYEMQLYVFGSWVVQSWIITPAFWILVDKKIVSVGKEHTTYVIFPINSWEFPPVENFFDMNFSGNNTAS